jgi:hypothetical protein
MSTSNDTITYDERSKRCIEKLELSERGLTNIHKALMVIYNTCETTESITYNANDKYIMLHCGRSLGSISFGLKNFTSDEVTI